MRRPWRSGSGPGGNARAATQQRHAFQTRDNWLALFDALTDAEAGADDEARVGVPAWAVRGAMAAVPEPGTKFRMTEQVSTEGGERRAAEA